MYSELSNPSEDDLSKTRSPALQILVFSLGSLYLAFPVEAVKKIISKFEIAKTELNYVSIARADGKEIIAIDLHKRLFKSSSEEPLNSPSYLLIAQNSVKEEFAIAISGNPPILKEPPLSQVRALPKSYQRDDKLKLASHVTIISQGQKSLTVLILDPDRLAPIFPHKPN